MVTAVRGMMFIVVHNRTDSQSSSAVAREFAVQGLFKRMSEKKERKGYLTEAQLNGAMDGLVVTGPIRWEE